MYSGARGKAVSSQRAPLWIGLITVKISPFVTYTAGYHVICEGQSEHTCQTEGKVQLLSPLRNFVEAFMRANLKKRKLHKYKKTENDVFFFTF